jgi:uncharacterized protein (UPF0335 family)
VHCDQYSTAPTSTCNGPGTNSIFSSALRGGLLGGVFQLQELTRRVTVAANQDINELFDRFTRIENEIKLLQDDKKELLAEFKDRVDPKAFQAALRSAKIRAKLKPSELQDFDQTLDILEKELCIEHID